MNVIDLHTGIISINDKWNKHCQLLYLVSNIFVVFIRAKSSYVRLYNVISMPEEKMFQANICLRISVAAIS